MIIRTKRALRTGLGLLDGEAFGVGGPVLYEVGEAEVGAGAGAGDSDGKAKASCGSGAVGGESGELGAWDDAAVLHVADEDFGSVGESGDEGAQGVEFAANAGAEAVVDEEGDLGAVGRDGGEVEELGETIVHFDGDVFCSGCG